MMRHTLKTMLVIVLVCVCWSNLASAAFVMSDGNISVFAFPGISYERTTANGINDKGQIVGTYDNAGETHGFIKDGDEFTSFTVPGATRTGPRDINDSGIIVGSYYKNDNWHAFVKEGDTIKTIGFPGATTTHATGITDSGVIVGDYWNGSTYFGFTLIGDTYTSFQPPGSSWTSVSGVNNLGQVVGECYDFEKHGFIKDGDVYTSFIPPFEHYSANGINDSGQTIGHYREGGRIFKGYIKEGAIYTPLVIPNATEIIPFGINNSGTIVGRHTVPEPSTVLLLSIGFLWMARRRLITGE